MNFHWLQVTFLVTALTACTTVKPPPNVSPPVAWAQRPDEVGKLRTGKVVAIERATYDDSIPQVGAKAATVVLPIGGVFIPLMMPPPSQSMSLRSVRQEYFRYTIQRSKSTDLEIWEDFVEYGMGSCLAARDQPKLIVPALPQECS